MKQQQINSSNRRENRPSSSAITRHKLETTSVLGFMSRSNGFMSNDVKDIEAALTIDLQLQLHSRSTNPQIYGYIESISTKIPFTLLLIDNHPETNSNNTS